MNCTVGLFTFNSKAGKYLKIEKKEGHECSILLAGMSLLFLVLAAKLLSRVKTYEQLRRQYWEQLCETV